MNITSGKISKAQKVVIYGPEGIGKSTFAAQFPNPVFIDTEGSTYNMDVRRMDKPTSWEMLKNQVNYIKNNPDVCKTLIIDTIDWAEQLCIESICAAAGKKGIEDFGYGNGYVYEKEEFGRFLNLLQEVIDVGINVVLTAHAQLRKFTQPDEIGEYDRWELKLGKKTGSQISPLVKEWADMVLFANYKTFAVAVDKDGKKFKAQGGERVCYTQHHPCWDAKNRFGLPFEIPFEFSQISDIFYGEKTIDEPKTQQMIGTPPAAEVKIDESEFEEITDTPNIPDGIPKPLRDLMIQNGVDEKEIRMAVSMRGYMPIDMPIENYPEDFVNGCLVAAWDKMYEIILDNRELPF